MRVSEVQLPKEAHTYVGRIAYVPVNEIMASCRVDLFLLVFKRSMNSALVTD